MNPRQTESTAYLGNLAKKGWLSIQPERFQEAIVSLGRWVTYPAGARVYTCGEPSDALIGIEQGHLDVLLPLTSEEECTFYRTPIGFWLGDKGLLKSEARTLSLETVTDCRIFKVPHTSLRQHLARHTGDWQCLYELAATRGFMTAGLLAEMLTLEPRVRIARLLLRLNKTGGVTSKQEDLARLAGVSRATFRRSIEELVKAGAVRTNYGKLELVDPVAVESMADY